MATIQSLPPELIRIILQADEACLYPVLRNAFLLVTSLVCRKWKVEAQAVLWEDLAIRLDEDAKRILACSLLGDFQTQGRLFRRAYGGRAR